MKLFRKLVVSIMLFVLIFTAADITGISSPAVAQAATVKISQKTLILEVGKSSTLQVTGTKKAIKWSTSKKTVATVTSKGKVTGKSNGEATITAAIGTKKYTCVVTVIENPYLTNAPFAAKEMKIGNITFVMPTGWKAEAESTTTAGYDATFMPEDTNLDSFIYISIMPTEQAAPDYSIIKEYFSSTLTEDFIKQNLKAELGDIEFEIKDFLQSDMEISLGNVFRTEYVVTVNDGSSIKQVWYTFYIDNVLIQIVASDTNNIDLAIQTDYMISSLTMK